MPATMEDRSTTLLTERWEQVSRKLTDLAEAIPDEKFEWTPVQGVRTCGDVLRHVAFWNEYVAASLRGKEFNDAANELPRADYPTKASVLDAVRRSAEDVSSALRDHRGSPDAETVKLVMTFNEHTSEHYGQLVVYARQAGVVPPASR
jgi:uncharacterized damage-inducible protein DinB